MYLVSWKRDIIFIKVSKIRECDEDLYMDLKFFFFFRRVEKVF